MTKAEKYIQDYTRACSNVFINPQLGGTEENHPWLTPDQARRAVEIAKEEVIEKACEWLKENVTYTHPRKGTTECIVKLTAFKEAMED